MSLLLLYSGSVKQETDISKRRVELKLKFSLIPPENRNVISF